MYKNYGDKDFFQYGRLLQQNSETEFEIIVCNPIDGKENRYEFGECLVDITDDWIDRKAVMNYAGMTEENFQSDLFALDCIEYYGIENFGGISYAYDCNNMPRERIESILEHKEILRKYKVCAEMITYCYLDVWAISEDAAMLKGEQMDGGEFIAAEGEGNWKIIGAKEI